MFSKEDLKKAKGVTLHLCGELVSRNGKEYRVYVIEGEDGTLVPEIEEKKPKPL